MFTSIRWRIMLPFVGLILLTTLGLYAYLSQTLNAAGLAEAEADLLGAARLFAAEIQSIPFDEDHADQLQAKAEAWSEALDLRISLIGVDGSLWAESLAAGRQEFNPLIQPEVNEAILQGFGRQIRQSIPMGTEALFVAVPIDVNGERIAIVRTAIPMSAIRAEAERIQRGLILAAVTVLALVVLLAYGIAERSVRPLRRLTDTAQQLADGNLGVPRPLVTSRDEVGKLTEAFGTMTEALQAQITATESERSKLAGVLQQMNDGVAIINEQGRVVLFNRAAERIFRIDAEQTLTHTIIEVLRHHQLFELWQQVRETGKEQVTTLELGVSGLFIQTVATPLGETLPEHVILLFQDLTKMRHLETVRRDFISNISHELRTPLASLKALAETLQDGALEDPVVARRFLTRMETEVDALTQTVAELLELSRIESGRVPMQFQSLWPAEMLTQAQDRMQMQAERAGVQLVCEFPPDLPEVLADPQRISQVLVNLIHNAIKFTPVGGKITLQAHLERDMVVFCVQDTGAGIPAADIPRIFERFYKTDRARASGGTGLGLSIAKHLVEAHGGRIWATSRLQEGSSFYFSLLTAGLG